jgi:hypothetical protein
MYELPEPPMEKGCRMHAPPSGISHTEPPSSGSQPAVGLLSLSAGLKCFGPVGVGAGADGVAACGAKPLARRGEGAARSRMSAGANPIGGANALASSCAALS